MKSPKTMINTKLSRGFEIKTSFEKYLVNICKHASEKCENQEYPAIYVMSWGRNTNQKIKEEYCYPISSSLDAGNV